MSFFNLYNHNFLRAAVCIPEVRVADPEFNAGQTIALMREAAGQRVALAVFPELGLSAYSCDDLFHQQALLDASLAALERVLRETRDVPLAAAIGLPLRLDGMLFNCAAVICAGRILGVVPKSYQPTHQEFYELRQFGPGERSRRAAIDLGGQRDVPFGAKLLFQPEEQPLATFAVEICEDLWAPIPPSSHAALAGANLLLNLSASNITIGKHEYRQQLVANQSARCVACYLYAGAGFGESTTELAWDGHGLIYENGTRIAETERFAYRAQLALGELDLDRIVQDRMRLTTFGQAAERHRESLAAFRAIRFSLPLPREGALSLARRIARFPYVPADPATRDERCQEVYEIQVQGLVRRLRAIGAKKVVIGVSGGLDSTQALIVCARAMDVMQLPRASILAYTMPGYGTSGRTLDQARRLMQAVGATAHEIDIRPSCEQMFKDIGHAFAGGEPVHDITFENVQAGERTSHLFRLANHHNAPVVGTSDLSEAALGWCTYGVGDHMAHYHVNASVPKTLIQYLIGYVARTGQLGAQASEVLQEVLETPISPELVPGETQMTEASVGPYELQDFNLYYTLRFGYLPRKVAFLAWCAWGSGGAEAGKYEIALIKKWLKVFLFRFFQISQYKRSAMPNAPKVGSGGSLSPRGDWRAPSDAEAGVWLANADTVPDRSD